MIKNIIDLLQTKEFIGVSKNVDIAKGLYCYPTNWKEFKNRIKRIWYAR